MDDCNAEVETMLQWMSHTQTGQMIDREISDLKEDSLCEQKLLTYQRYNVSLSKYSLNEELGLGLNAEQIDAIQEMDAPENIKVLERIGLKLGSRVEDVHFPTAFDLTMRGEQQ